MNASTGNVFKQLKSLVSDKTTSVGTSQGANGDGTTDVLLVGGGVIKVSGEGYLNGTSVFIQNGFITGAAPNLSPVVLDV